ncbi:MAG: alpha-mannosidase [Chloroflexota bacterium]
MALSITQRVERLRSRTQEIGFWRDREDLELGGWQFDDEPLAVGGRWPADSGLHRLVANHVQVPGAWPLAETELRLDLGGEGLVGVRYADGVEQFGLDPWHRSFPVREREFCLEVEIEPRYPFGVPNRDPRVNMAQLVWIDRAVERIERQLELVAELAESLGNEETTEPLLDAAERAFRSLDWPSATQPYLRRTRDSPAMLQLWQAPDGLTGHTEPLTDDQRSSVWLASDRLDEALKRLQGRYPNRGRIALSGHAHLDLAWLWPIEATRRKFRRTASSAVALQNRYPEMRFNQSSAQLYAFLEEDDPELFEQVRAAAAGGQWEPIGGMWVEPDSNMPCGESLVRQLLYGQRYFQRVFGRRSEVCWLPDCFGFSPALPQLLRLAGIKYFSTTKLSWSETNPFPNDLFWWEGLDGSQVLAHFFDNPERDGMGGYNGDVQPAALLETWRRYRQKEAHPETLLTVGYGDGGGGPTGEMMRRQKALETFPAVPSAHFTAVQEFFQEAEKSAEAAELPAWVGELYLELHRGTLTTQGRTKRLHRRAERELVAAEVIASLDALLGGEPPEPLEAIWRVLLRNQFHDILPGSSIHEVYQRAEAELGEVVDRAGATIGGRLNAMSERLVAKGDHDGLLVVNPDVSPRKLRVELPGEYPGAQRVEGGSVISSSEEVPGLGVAVVSPGRPESTVTAGRQRLENRAFAVQFDDGGRLISVYDKRAGREVLSGPANQIWAFVDKPRKWDAWDVDADYELEGEEVLASKTEVLENGPHRAALRVIRYFRHSTVQQDVRLWANSARLEFKTTIDWHDRHWLLQARFPLAIRAEHATFETAFGVVQRPTHRNTSWDAARFEVAGHRFADLSEPGYGVALLNDGKYGHYAHGNVLGLSLLRSPTHPDPLSDEGRQTFTYALLPHRGGWLEGGVLGEAEDLNRPLLARSVSSAGEHIWQPLAIEGLAVGLGALKPLEDGGGLVLRLYEPRGARRDVSLMLQEGWRLSEELDLLEEPVGEPVGHFNPFQIRSWKIERE